MLQGSYAFMNSLKKETAPQRYTRWGGSILLQVEPTITARDQKATP